MRYQKLEYHETQGQMENQNLEKWYRDHRRVSLGIGENINISSSASFSPLTLKSQIIHSYPFFSKP